MNLKPRHTILAILLVVAIALFAWLYNARNIAPEAEAAWYHDAWRYRLRLAIDSTKVDEKLTSFPVAVILNSTRIDYSKTQNSGQDIRFTDMNGNLLDYEIEKWDAIGIPTGWYLTVFFFVIYFLLVNPTAFRAARL